jgi:dTMP kinase
MLIAIEGIDGSGKGTQASLLATQAQEAGLTAAVFSFPGYANNAFGEAVGQYLNGKFGDVGQVAPQLAAILYAGDRYATKEALTQSCEMCDLVIADRYVPSNLAHQAAKLPPDERAGFIHWISTIEYKTFGLPHASMVFYLDMPVRVAADLVLRKKKRNYTSLATDIHERDVVYLQHCKDVYEFIMKSDQDSQWHRIACTTSNGLREPSDIGRDIWQPVCARLSPAQAHD